MPKEAFKIDAGPHAADTMTTSTVLGVFTSAKTKITAGTGRADFFAAGLSQRPKSTASGMAPAVEEAVAAHCSSAARSV
jgi:hypothetical protein